LGERHKSPHNAYDFRVAVNYAL